MAAITAEVFKEWLRLTGNTVRGVAEQTGISKSRLARWTNGVAKLNATELSALQQLARGKPVAVGAAPQIAAEVKDAGDMQRLAREATADCLSFWRAIVVDPAAPMATRVRASEDLMNYAWGVPPKLQAERKTEAPAKDNELIEKFGRLAGAKPT